MRIAFYAPLKSPNHPVISGDRQMARLLVRALEHAGHTVEVASELRAYLPEPQHDLLNAFEVAGLAEARRLEAAMRVDEKPDIWFTYHPYYKSPDLIGPQLASALSIPYVTTEASYSNRRNIGAWTAAQAKVAAAVRQAAVNLCFTRRDHGGLMGNIPDAALAMLPPFIDIDPFQGMGRARLPGHLVTVAMMRAGDKLDSYRMLARSLGLLEDRPWHLSIVGDGPCRDEVRSMFDRFAGRIKWHGQLTVPEVADVLSSASLYVWPGYGEAFGLAYIEAQANGLPVIAQHTAGVPEIVLQDETGLLAPEGDVEAFAEAVARLLSNAEERQRLGAHARRRVETQHSLPAAAQRLDDVLTGIAL